MYHKTTLENGLRVVTSTMPHTQSASFCLFIGVGSRYEDDSVAGVSHFIEHLLFKGTKKRPSSGDICSAIEGVGGILNAGTNKELTIYWTKTAKTQFPLSIDVITDILLHSKFDPAEIERERQVIIEEINMSEDSPASKVNEIIDELLWPGHPLGRDTAGSKESMAGISRKAIIDYLHAHYLPRNAVVSVAGNIKHQEAVDMVGAATAKWKNNKNNQAYLPYKPQPNPRLRIENKDIEQAHICLGLPGLSLTDPRRFTLDLLNVILGEGMSSRLFLEIRDKMGLAYNIYSSSDHFLDSGCMTVYAGVDPKNIAATLKAVMEQLALMKEPVQEEELARAKEMAKGRMMLRMEDTRDVAGWTGGQEILSGRALRIEQVTKLIDEVTAEDMQKIAEELLVSEQLRLAVVGPVKKEEPLEGLLNI
jgi:predicted Zn-dependent peptidase